ncbi:MAG: hypothetical protein F4Z96_05770 [Chloroflexi bacterium]|nr:hypothetical protein [Chloroflexota bacterium]
MRRGNVALLGGGLAVALLVVLVLAPNAASSPDGLERVAEDQGFADSAEGSRFDLLPDYTIPGVENEAASTVLAGTVGVLVVAAITLLAARILRARAARPR